MVMVLMVDLVVQPYDYDGYEHTANFGLICGRNVTFSEFPSLMCKPFLLFCVSHQLTQQ